MPKTFICYRRAEAEYAAGSLARELRRQFGEEQVFRDKEDVGGGLSWKKQVGHEIDRGAVLLVLVGRDWAGARDAKERRRLDNVDDPVRLELLDAMNAQATIVPILLENAEMPASADLPPDLAWFSDLNALKLRDGDWQYDLDRICAWLDKHGFVRVAASAGPAAAASASAARPARSIKLVASYVLAGLGFVSYNAVHDSNAATGFAIIGAFAVVLAALVLRERVRAQSPRWPAITAILVSGIVAVGYVGFAIDPSGLPANAALSSQAPAPSTSNVAALEPRANVVPAPAPANVIVPAASVPAAAARPAKVGETPRSNGTATDRLIGIWYGESSLLRPDGVAVSMRGTTQYFRNSSAVFNGQVAIGGGQPAVVAVYDVVMTGEWQVAGSELVQKIVDVRSQLRDLRVNAVPVDLRMLGPDAVRRLPKIEDVVPKGMSSEAEIVDIGPATLRVRSIDAGGNPHVDTLERRDRPFDPTR